MRYFENCSNEKEMEVLIARLQVWINRRRELLSRAVSSTIHTCGDVWLDHSRRRAVRRERKIPLTDQEFKLLEYLIENKGELVSQPRLFSAVWNNDFEPDTNVVRLAVNRLRKKIEIAGEPQFIKTVINGGYIVGDTEQQDILPE